MKTRKLLGLLLALGLLSAALCGCGGGSTGQTAESKPTDGSTSTEAQAPADTQPTEAHPNEITVGIAQDLDESLDPHKAVAAGT